MVTIHVLLYRERRTNLFVLRRCNVDLCDIEKRIKCLDERTKHLFIPELFSDKTIIDAGACTGSFIESIRRLGINSRIIAIEPNNSNFKILSQKRLDNVVLMHNALVGSSVLKTIVFNEVIGLSEWGSVTNINDTRGRAAIRRKLKYEVKTTTLEDIVQFEVDYIKMDIECSETEVIRTLTQKLSQKIKQISFEVHNKDELILTKILQDLEYLVFFRQNEIFAVRKELV